MITKPKNPAAVALGRMPKKYSAEELRVRTERLKAAREKRWPKKDQKWHVCCKNKECANHNHGWVPEWSCVRSSIYRDSEAKSYCPICSTEHNCDDLKVAMANGVWKTVAEESSVRRVKACALVKVCHRPNVKDLI